MAHVNHHNFLEESLRKGPKSSVIHVKNLYANASVGVDVWGRVEDSKVNKFQPVQISASIAMKEPFVNAAASDVVDGSTVNYGILSKEVLKCLKLRAEHNGMGAEHDCIKGDWTLAILLDSIYSWLTHQSFLAAYHQRLDAVENEEQGNSPWEYPGLLSYHANNYPRKAIVELESVQELELSCFLPKGSFLGSGVSLRALIIPAPLQAGGIKMEESSDIKIEETPEDSPEPKTTSEITSHKSLIFCSILKLHDLRVPTLIGVNANERLAKQMVIANVEIEGYMVDNIDLYNKLEQIVVKTLEESSFETLERLADHLINRIIKWFIFSEYDSFKTKSASGGPDWWQQVITVYLEKPTAVMFADAPMIQMRRIVDPKLPALAPAGGNIATVTKVPFPLQGRLCDWIQKVDSMDST